MQPRYRPSQVGPKSAVVAVAEIGVACHALLDGSVQGMEESLKRLAALQQIEANRSSGNTSVQA